MYSVLWHRTLVCYYCCFVNCNYFHPIQIFCLWSVMPVILFIGNAQFVWTKSDLFYMLYFWILSKDHIRYELHSCQSSYKKNIQVPVCPLCNQPVPWKRGEAPDIAVGAHIDQDCQSDPAKSKRKVFGNRCSMKGCKQKEVVPVICDKCKLNHCLKHRHPCDHSCKGNNAADSSAGSYLARAR